MRIDRNRGGLLVTLRVTFIFYLLQDITGIVITVITVIIMQPGLVLRLHCLCCGLLPVKNESVINLFITGFGYILPAVIVRYKMPYGYLHNVMFVCS